MRLFSLDDASDGAPFEPEKEPAAAFSEVCFETASNRFLAHQELVRRVAMRYAPSKEVVDDIVQQVYIEFAGRAEQWDFSTDIAPLLVVMTRNFARRLWREHLRMQPEARRQVLEMLRQRTETREALYGREEREALRGCIETLPPKARQIIHDYYYHRIPLDKIAEEMRKSPETLRRALCRYRVKLRSCIRKILHRNRGGRE